MVKHFTWVAASLYLFFFGLLLAPTLVGNKRLAFRDVSHFYLPMYEYVHSRIDDGELPLWNPLDRFGVPVVGETTSGLFYPGNFVFHLGLAVETALGVHVLLHLMIAAIGVYLVARHQRLHWLAATLAGITYAAAGPVLFCYTNPPFLVSAAWLPIGFYSLQLAIQRFTRRRLVVGSVAVAMMILGGDVQTAANAFLCLCGYIAVRSLGGPGWAWRALRWLHGVKVIVLALGLITSMAAIQIVPSYLWSQHSARRHAEIPGISTMITPSPVLEASGSIWSPPRAGTHHASIYEYSVGPWQWLDLFIPRVSGSLFPINSRVTRCLPAEGRTWTPSLFAGMFSAVCLLMRLAHWRHQRINVWDGLMLVGLGCSLGIYGGGWLLAELHLLDAIHFGLAGPYWSLVTLVPGYSAFRYPAKWLVFFTLGLAIRVGHAADHSRLGTDKLSARMCVVLAVGGLLLAVGGLAWNPDGNAPVEGDLLFGPLNLQAIRWNLLTGGIQATVMCGLLFGILRYAKRDPRSALVLLLACTTAELYLFARLCVGQVPFAVSDSQVFDPSLRAIQLTGKPDSLWQQTSSSDRLEQVDRYEQDRLLMRWHLSRRIAKLNSAVSIEHWRTQFFWSECRRALGRHRGVSDRLKLERLANHLAVDAWIQRHDASLSAVVSRGLPGGDPGSDGRFMPDMPEQPAMLTIERRWKASDLETICEAIVGRLDAVLRDDPSAALVETFTVPLFENELQARILQQGWSGERVTGVIDCSSNVLVKFQQLQDGQWMARTKRFGRSEPWAWRETHHVDLVAQGFFLPAGTWEVEVLYRPAWLLPCAMLSLSGWLICLVFLVLDMCGRSKRKTVAIGLPR